MVLITTEQIDRLSVEERLDLLEQITVSLENEEPQPPLTAAQRVEVERRLALHEKGELPYRDWEDVRWDLKARHK